MDGIVIIDKPPGMTSHDVVARARRILRERRIGHTGTLDPFATGVLVLLIGRATRLAQFISAADKEYEAVIRLGFATDTGDVDGKPIESTRVTQFPAWSNETIQAAFARLRGESDQLPPMYSAKKREGKKLYELAREGKEVERPPVRVFVHAFEPIRTHELLKDNRDGTMDLRVRVVCSAGTYVRVLAEDFGKLLGVGAHLAELRRTRAGEFSVKTATSLERLQQLVAEEALGTVLLPPDSALSSMPFLHLSSVDAQKARHGMTLSAGPKDWLDGEKVRLKDEGGQLIGIGYYDSSKQQLRPRVVLDSENTD